MALNIRVKKDADIDILRQAGVKHASVLKDLYHLCQVGVLLTDIDDRARSLVQSAGGRPAFLDYQPVGASRPFPAAVCVSINEEIVHGIPSPERRLKDGDIVSVDLGFELKGLITDSAFTKVVGQASGRDLELVKATRKALRQGVLAVKGGCRVGDIGAAIESSVSQTDFVIIRHLAGHGVGYAVHEDPYIPNTGVAGQGPVLPVGSVIAIEPMLSYGSSEIVLGRDGYTYSTDDGSKSTHFEQTVLVTDKGSEILTPFLF